MNISKAILLMIGSLALFFAVFYYLLDQALLPALIFVGIFVVHEAGHVYALLRLRMPIKAVYFIPMLGAAVVPGRPFNSFDDQAYAKYWGPLAGMILTTVLWMVYIYSRDNVWLIFVFVSSLINALNMVPMVFLDGSAMLHGFNRNLKVLATLLLLLPFIFTFQMQVFGVLAILCTMLFSDADDASNSFFWHEVVIAISCIVLIAVLTYLDPQNLMYNLPIALLALYCFGVYIKATCFSKKQLTKLEPLVMIGMTHRQKWRWAARWLVLSSVLSVSLYYSSKMI